MNPLRLTLSFYAVALLTACVTMSEQKAARVQTQKRYEQGLQANLAVQCDQETAALTRRKLDEEGKSGVITAEQKVLCPKYTDKVSDPMFQACYKMAWQNYISQEQLREARYYRYYGDWGYPPGRYPWWW